MHHLDVRDVMPSAASAVRGPRCCHGVQRLPDRPVADRVAVDLESVRIDQGDGLFQLVGVEEA
jgi:hypothetical protein